MKNLFRIERDPDGLDWFLIGWAWMLWAGVFALFLWAPGTWVWLAVLFFIAFIAVGMTGSAIDARKRHKIKKMLRDR